MGKTAPSGGQPHVDVLIVTAVKEEYDAVLEVDTGAVQGSRWEKQDGPIGLEVAFREFRTLDGRSLRVAATRALEMGGVAATNAAVPLVTQYAPRCLAMCGVCAGRRGEVELGDVIVADRLWFYDAGKIKVTVEKESKRVGKAGKRIERFEHDISTYPLNPAWKQKADGFVPDQAKPWLSQRPRTYDQQSDWLLERLLRGEDPSRHRSRRSRCANYDELEELLREKKLIRNDVLELTKAGRACIEKQLRLHGGKLPAPKPFKVHVAPIGSGNAVVQDPELFKRLSSSMRKNLGVEMEAGAIGAMAHLHRIPFAIVMKGVMDFADSEKNDNFKPFAARASAECLLAFLRAHWPRQEGPAAARAPATFSSAKKQIDEVLHPGTAPRPRDPSPAALLDARHGYVPFFEPGRRDMLQWIDEFCDGPECAAVWLVHAPGGMGKTRLLIEACERLCRGGWRAGFLASSAEPAHIEALCASNERVLVVIDYAESRPGLAELLRPVVRLYHSQGSGPVRVILLARNAGDWWSYLSSSDAKRQDLLSQRPPLELPPLAARQQERVEAFRHAAGAFAAFRKRPPPEQPAISLDDAQFEAALYLHMAALAAVDGLSFTADTLMSRVLDHEQRFWLHRIRPVPPGFSEQRFVAKAQRVIAALTLRGGIPSRTQAEALFERVGAGRDEGLLELFRDLYPGAIREGGAGYLKGLEPDLLGEAMVQRALAAVDAEGEPLPEWLDRVFEGADGAALQKGFEVLGRLSEDHAGAMRPLIAHLLEQDLPGRAVLALEAAKAIGARTAHALLGAELAVALGKGGDAALARKLSAAGIPEMTVSLREVAAWTTAALLAGLPRDNESIDTLAQRARLLNNLSVEQSALGQREEALASTRQAVEIYGELSKKRPDAFLPVLAGNLSNLGLVQSELGQREEALASTRQAVEIRRELSKKRPDAFLPYLAISLNNLGNIQSELGQREEALASTRQGVEIRRELSKKRPDAFLPYLASSLNNLGIRQSELGQREEALASTRQAVEIRRELSKKRPDAFLPDLAISLNNLGAMQSKLGQREEALASAQEALDAIWPLFVALPQAFSQNTGIMLDNLVRYHQELGCAPGDELIEKVAAFRKLSGT